MSKVSVSHEPGGVLRVATPYDPGFVAMVKTLPPSAKAFDPSSKTWLIDGSYHADVQRWLIQFYGYDAGNLKPASVAPAKTETQVLDVWYLGTAKQRTISGDSQAMGMDKAGQWRYVFPEDVLREWFEGVQVAGRMPAPGSTLYSILGVQRMANYDDIKTAYRRMVKQWHPDVCQEDNAADMFRRIQEAYEMLSKPEKRVRYDAGLALEESLVTVSSSSFQALSSGYRSPMRCGYVLAEGIDRMGRFVVSKILSWEDIYNQVGQTLVTSWPMGAKEPIVLWV